MEATTGLRRKLRRAEGLEAEVGEGGQVGAGNRHDSKTFASITDGLVERYRLLSEHCEELTLVFDQGNNSRDNFAAVEESPYHFVGSLPYDQHPGLLDIPRKKLRSLSHPRLARVEVYRTSKQVMGVERTVLVTYNDNLYLSQLRSIANGLRKRTAKLGDLQTALRRRGEGRVTRGKAPTLERVNNQVRDILNGRHMKGLITTHVYEKRGVVTVTYRCDQTAFNRLSRRVLGTIDGQVDKVLSTRLLLQTRHSDYRHLPHSDQYQLGHTAIRRNSHLH